MIKYFFRIDDVAPNMNWENFNYLVAIFKKYEIKPLLAVIPDNQDPNLLKHPPGLHFWQIINQLRHDEWMVAQHGFEHLYKMENGGILGINRKSEFAGLRFETQKEMIFAGKQILKDKIVEPEIFVAPAHSFDKNTIRALKENNFNSISDGIALYPFKKWGIIWLPQVLWRPRKILFGMVTVAIHSNTMSSEDFNNLGKFIEKNRKIIGNFSELISWHDRQNVIIKFLTFFINQAFKFCWRIAFKLKHGLSG